MSRIESKAGEFLNAAKAVEQMPEAAQAAVRGLCQCQSEAARLMSRRTRAWLELPSTLSSCRTVPDVVRTQADFVQAFWSDWLGTGQRVSAVWMDTIRQEARVASEAVQAASPARTARDDTDPMAVWEWWRTDMKGIMPRRNESSGPSANDGKTH